MPGLQPAQNRSFGFVPIAAIELAVTLSRKQTLPSVARRTLPFQMLVEEVREHRAGFWRDVIPDVLSVGLACHNLKEGTHISLV
ncbi:MAG: hypothetical protein EOO39_37080, partial [Cytophagaceae bacterium]